VSAATAAGPVATGATESMTSSLAASGQRVRDRPMKCSYRLARYKVYFAVAPIMCVIVRSTSHSSGPARTDQSWPTTGRSAASTVSATVTTSSGITISRMLTLYHPSRLLLVIR
jgi:hypothetical protein